MAYFSRCFCGGLLLLLSKPPLLNCVDDKLRQSRLGHAGRTKTGDVKLQNKGWPSSGLYGGIGQIGANTSLPRGNCDTTSS